KINGKVFTPGSIVILKSDNEADFVQKINKASHTFGIELTAIQSGFIPQGVDLGSSDIQYLKAPKVAVLANEPTSAMNVGEIWHFLDQQLNYPLSLIDAGNLRRKDLSKYDVLILPSGNYSSLSDGEVDKLKDWTREGGVLIAMGSANGWLSNQ